MVRRKQFDDDSPANHLPAPRSTGKCTAFGCPLGGFIFHTTGPEGDGWCLLHAKYPDEDTQGLTRAINARKDLFFGVRAILCEVDLPTWWREMPGKYARPFKGRPDLMPTKEERQGTILAWHKRVFRVLENECLAAIGVTFSGMAVKTEAEIKKRPFERTPEELEEIRLAEEELATRKVIVPDEESERRAQEMLRKIKTDVPREKAA